MGSEAKGTLTNTVKIEMGYPFLALFGLYRMDVFDGGVLLTQ
jgi:hypothetical protein